MSSVDTTEEVVGEVVSIEGVVKWFDPVKGYGFIVPNDSGMALQNGDDDIYLQESDQQPPPADDASPGEELDADR